MKSLFIHLPLLALYFAIVVVHDGYEKKRIAAAKITPVIINHHMNYQHQDKERERKPKKTASCA